MVLLVSQATLLVLLLATPPAARAQDLSLDVTGVGTIVVPAGAEPADVVVRFARETLRRGVPGLNNRDALQQILDYFCTKRACVRALPETLTINNFASESVLVVDPWLEPADAIEAHLLEFLEREGSPSAVSQRQAMNLLSKLCKQTVCFRGSLRVPESEVQLTVEGIGQLTVGSMQEPADAVEAFALAVASAGVTFGFDQMRKLMEYFCARRICTRLELAPPPMRLSLEVEGIGQITVQPNQDPADVVEEFARQARSAGFQVLGDDMLGMMKFFCDKRSCARTELNGDVVAQMGGVLKLEIPGVGSMNVNPDQEPADVVEEFTRQANAAGAKIGGPDLIKMLAYFCERRECQRRELNPLAAGIAME
jgi:hypothetical protein